MSSWFDSSPFTGLFRAIFLDWYLKATGQALVSQSWLTAAKLRLGESLEEKEEETDPVKHSVRIDTANESTVRIYNGSSTVDVSAGQTLKVQSDIYITKTCSGANGLDIGVPRASSWYYIYLIGDGQRVDGLLSLSAQSPTLPSGYTMSKLVGSVYAEDDGKFTQSSQLGGSVVTTSKLVFNGVGVSKLAPKTLWDVMGLKGR